MIKRKILLIAPKYLDLYINIVECLKNKGYKVDFIEDPNFGITPHLKNRRLIRRIHFYFLWKKVIKKYWGHRLNNIKRDYSNIIIINGVSIDKRIIKELKKKNPIAKISFFAWDSMNHYDTKRFIDKNVNFFTFDINDSKKYKLNFLPIFWEATSYQEKVKYDIFGLGTNHDCRYSFFKKIVNLLKKTDLKYYIKVYDPKLSPDETITNQLLPTNDFTQKISQSKIILDDSRPGQGGLTPRFIWALGQGKKILTTNKFVFDYPFVHKEQVQILDRANPEFDFNFINSKLSKHDKERIIKEIENYEINNWVEILL